MSDLIFTSAYQLAQGVRKRAFSAVEVLEEHLAHIAQYNPTLNAIITLNENALGQAQAADEALARGEVWGPLHGVPMTCKDLLETQGVRTTFSHPAFANYIPSKDALIVSRLRGAGAILLGKTNVPPQGGDFQTISPLFGRTNNPWAVGHTPGGSTGGGAAAIAAGLSPLELGNDLGGSLRIPAHFCGVYALKPTEYRVPNSLRSKTLRHMLTTGPIARSVEDLRLCLNLLEGADGLEWEVPPIPGRNPIQRTSSEFRLAWCDRFDGLVADSQTQTALTTFADQLAGVGCHVEQVTPDFNFMEAWEVFGALCTGQIAWSKNGLLRAMGRGISQILPGQWIPGGPIAPGFLRGFTLSLADYMEILARRDRLVSQMDRFLQNWDGLICPVTPGPAFVHQPAGSPLSRALGGTEDKQPYWFWGMGFTCIFSMTGNPVVTLPLPSQGLPIGIQLVGRRWQDRELLVIAEAIESLTGGFRRPPQYG